MVKQMKIKRTPYKDENMGKGREEEKGRGKEKDGDEENKKCRKKNKAF